jgi:hypothetical protein
MAEARAKENSQFRLFLKRQTRLSSQEVDHLVFRLESKVWQRIDCTTCANCCRHVAPMLGEDDVARLAGHLGLSNADFIARYLDKAQEAGPSPPWIVRELPCPFLKDSRCTVYEHRPGTCRDYPYLSKPDFTFRTLAMMERLADCPAVFEAWEDLKRATGFRHRPT